MKIDMNLLTSLGQNQLIAHEDLLCHLDMVKRYKTLDIFH